MIHGRLGDGTACTLLDNFIRLDCTQQEGGEFFRTHVDAEVFVEGVHCSDLSLPLARLSCRFSHLEEWFGPPFRVEHSPDGAGSRLITEVPTFAVSSEWRGRPFVLELHCTRSIPSVSEDGGPQWRYHYELAVCAEEPTDAEWFLEVASVVREALMFLIGSFVTTLDLVGSPALAVEAGDRREIRIAPVTAVPSPLRLERRNSVRLGDAVRDALPVFFEVWFQRRPNHVVQAKGQGLGVVIDGYVGVLSRENIELEATFLQVAQLLERLHGLTAPKSETRYYSKKQWRDFLEWLRASFPYDDDNKEAIVQRVGNLNKFSFKSRIKELVRAVPGPKLMPVMGNPEKPEAAIATLIDQVDTSRNFYTHLAGTRKTPAASGEDLRRIAATLWCVLTFHLAVQVGLPEPIACDLMMQARHELFPRLRTPKL